MKKVKIKRPTQDYFAAARESEYYIEKIKIPRSGERFKEQPTFYAKADDGFYDKVFSQPRVVKITSPAVDGISLLPDGFFKIDATKVEPGNYSLTCDLSKELPQNVFENLTDLVPNIRSVLAETGVVLNNYVYNPELTGLTEADVFGERIFTTD